MLANMIYGKDLANNLKSLVAEITDAETREQRKAIAYIIQNIFEVAEQTAKEYCLVLEENRKDK